MTNRAPLIAAFVLLLLPVLYVGSYLALVVPEGRVAWISSPTGFSYKVPVISHYRAGYVWPQRIFWPLEQSDRKLRPEAWE